MRNFGKCAIAAAAIIVGVWCANRAEAGNASIPTAMYYSVKLVPGQYFTYGGADPDAVLLVDDVTYSADINTSMLQVTPPVAYFAEVFGTYPPINFPIPGISDFGTVFARARGAQHHLTLEEEDPTPTSTFEVFDRFSHSTHAEVFILHEEVTVDQGSTIFEPAGVFRGPNGMVTPRLLSSNRARTLVHNPASPPEVTLLDTTGVSTFGWATPTSGSRHYQSPQIVQTGNRVWLKNGGSKSYNNGVCYVKGRLILDANCAPVEATSPDVSVVVP